MTPEAKVERARKQAEQADEMARVWQKKLRMAVTKQAAWQARLLRATKRLAEYEAQARGLKSRAVSRRYVFDDDSVNS